MLKIQRCITEINYIFKYIKIEKHFYILIIFQNITVFSVFFYPINAGLMSIRHFHNAA